MSEQIVSKEFKISDERVAQIGREFLMIGQQHRLEPWELCVTMQLVQQWMADQFGLVVKEHMKSDHF